MCGIIGVVGEKNPFPFILKALKAMEYRGYDSAGIYIDTNEGIYLKKDVGRVDDIFSGEKGAEGIVGMGHTRWATHGKVTKENAHPHLSNSGMFVIVHNGVIENFDELKEYLLKKGYRFRSETDTEVIVNLLEDIYKEKGDLLKSLEETIKRLKGSFAFLVQKRGEPRIYFVRKDTPLLIGLGRDIVSLSSDIAGLVGRHTHYIPLNDYDFGYITKGSFRIFNLKEGEVTEKREKYPIPKSMEEAQKGRFPHFMRKEIEEQRYRAPESHALPIPDLSEFFQGRVDVVASGTSYHAAVYFSKLMRSKGKDVFPFIASEYLTEKPAKRVLAVSQSGETMDVLLAVKRVKEEGGRVISLVNIPGSTLDRESEETVYINAGLEIGVAATKTFTSQIAVLERMAGIQRKQEEIRDAVTSALMLEEKAKAIAKELASEHSIFYLGRGLAFPFAMEGALKMKEVSYIHAEAYPSGELKHGPLALIEEGTKVLLLMPKELEVLTVPAYEEVKARGAHVYLLTDFQKEGAVQLKGPWQYSFTTFLQLIAYHTAVILGRDPDKPRNLAKSVTVQ